MAGPVEAALKAGEIYIVFQPIVDLQNGNVFAHEALVRGSGPGLQTAGEVIASAVEHEFMGELGRQLRTMSVAGCPQERLFLNIHPAEFSEGWLVRPDDPIFTHERDIYLEITESVPITHFAYCQSVLKEVRSKGLFLVVDDLGAGYSNLKYIADLAPEVVKVDRELIADVETQPRMRTLLRSVVRMCEDMGAMVVAEGVETAEQLRISVDAGAHFAQGYYIARPAFPAPVVQWENLADGGVPQAVPAVRR